MKDNLLKKFLSFSYGSWVGLVIGLLTTMVITRILSPEHFGRSAMFNTAMNVLMVFIIFGTDQSFVRFFYEESEDKRGGLLYNCIKIPMLVAVTTIFIVIIYYKQITMYLFEEQNLYIAIILAFAVLIQAVHRFTNLVIRMQQKAHLFSMFTILTKVIDFGLILLFYSLFGNRYEIIIYSSVLTALVLTVASIFIEKNYWNISNFNIKGLKHSKIEIFQYAYPLVLTSLISWIFTSFDNIALKQWSTFTEIGLYSAASKIVALLLVLQSTFTTFWTPVCYEHYEKAPEDKKFFEKTSTIITISMFVLAIISIAGKDVIVLLLGSEYRESSNIMPFLVFMPIMYTISETTVIGINFFKKPKWHILIVSTACITNIVGNWMLVPQLGAKGAAISTAFSYILFFSMRTHISLKYYKVNYGLDKIYTLLGIISVYAIYATFRADLIMNILAGIIVLALLWLLYFKDIRTIYESYLKEILVALKKKVFNKK